MTSLFAAGMFESIAYFTLGFSVAAIIAFSVTPPLYQRALRLAALRRDAALKLIAKIRADKTRLSAELARSTCSFEATVQDLKDKIATLRAELGKNGDAINRLQIERNMLKMEIETFRGQAL